MVWRGRVYEGRNHAEIIHRLATTITKAEWPVTGLQGFTTTKGVFVDRETARIIAKDAGQIIYGAKQNGKAVGHHPTKLFSEDFDTLYDPDQPEPSDFIPMPFNLEMRNGGKKCDMLQGPCACGAWHKLEHLLGRILKEFTDNERPREHE